VLDAHDRSNGDELAHVLLEEFGVLAHSCEHLGGSLAVADVQDLLLAGVLHDVLPESRLVVGSHLIEAVVEVLVFLFGRAVV